MKAGMQDTETPRAPGDPPKPGFANGNVLAKVRDPTGYEVVFDIYAWEHIRNKHPEIEHLDLVCQALREPNLVQEGSDPDIRFYYRLVDSGPRKGLYVAVVVETEIESSGFVKTAYLSRKSKSEGELLWTRR